MEETADAMSSVAPMLQRYFSGRESDVGARMLDAWRDGIRISLGLVKDFIAATKPQVKQARKLADSDGRLLEHLRNNGGIVTATLIAIAAELGLPASTLSQSVKRLVERKFVQRTNRTIRLLPREV